MSMVFQMKLAKLKIGLPEYSGAVIMQKSLISCNHSSQAVISFIFFSKGDGRTCVDINECLGENVCDKRDGLCVNTVGSYVCSCQPGFRISEENFTCIGEKSGLLLFQRPLIVLKIRKKIDVTNANYELHPERTKILLQCGTTLKIDIL